MGAQSKLLVRLGLNNLQKIDQITINNRVTEICKIASELDNKDKILWLIRAIKLIDLTSLNTDDTQETIEALTVKVNII